MASSSKSDHTIGLDHDPMNIDSTINKQYPSLKRELLEKLCKDASKAFFDEFGLISHQINSFNQFMSSGIQELFDSLDEVIVEPGYDPSKGGGGDWRHATIKYGKVKLEKPAFWTDKEDKEDELKLYPRHARLQNMTYSSKMKMDLTVQVYKLDRGDKAKTGKDTYMSKHILSEVQRETYIGSIPVMVKSKYCWLASSDKSDCLFDSGGYFIVKGAEKTFIAQEHRSISRLWITDKPTWMASHASEVKRQRIYVKLVDSSNGGKNISIYFLYATMSIWIMFFALGVTSDKEIFDIIDMDNCDSRLTNILLATIKEADKQCEGFRKHENAQQYVDSLVKSSKFPPTESFDEYITNFFFPTIKGYRQKALFLGYTVKCLLLSYFGKRKLDNKDDFRNKRLFLVSELLTKELYSHVKRAEKNMVRLMQRDLLGDRELHFERYWDSSIITNGLYRAFATGHWCHPYLRGERCSGIVANLRRTNPLEMLSDLRKTRFQVSYLGKAGDARYPNPSYWGKLCFLSTPDGENCGLVKNLALSALISSKLTDSSPRIASSSKYTKTSKTTDELEDRLVSCGMEKIDEISISAARNKYKVLLNGNWIGVCSDSESFVVGLRDMRRSQQINYQVEIKLDDHQKEVRIFSDAGRILRPLLVVENLNKINNIKEAASSSSSPFKSLLSEGIVEFVGVEEEEDCKTAWGVSYLLQDDNEAPVYTHCELDPSFITGPSCGIIPFANHNYARRVLFQAEKHSHQAIGYSTTNPDIRVDTLMHQMYYPQRPLFRTFAADSLGRRDYTLGAKDGLSRPELFNGQNAIVAVNVHQGYNQEDSIVMNQTSLQRGMFRTEHFRSYKSDVENKELAQRIKPKDKVVFGKMQSRKGRVDNLEDDGFPYVGASLQSGDIIIGKTAESGEDHSTKLKHTEKGMVHKVVLSANDEGKNFAVVTLRQVRSPILGDKFSSMHGQKGVVGFLDSQENFPFTLQGVVPDIVINPHAFPTRQTPGQLLEAALGKGIALGGKTTYATPFTTPSVDVITEQLHSLKFQRWGSERVTNGRTGSLMKSMIFIGPAFYQRLIHMAEDKVKFRNTGPVHPLTRQPVADRKRFGGVKFGEMERDCLLAHGAAANLHERLFTLSDFSQMHICRTCSHVANVIQRAASNNMKIRGPYCSFCKSAENIVRVNVPYGAKLLYQELFSMGICLKFDTEIA